VEEDGEGGRGIERGFGGSSHLEDVIKLRF
jgi:hypothetical protein